MELDDSVPGEVAAQVQEQVPVVKASSLVDPEPLRVVAALTASDALRSLVTVAEDPQQRDFFPCALIRTLWTIDRTSWQLI